MSDPKTPVRPQRPALDLTDTEWKLGLGTLLAAAFTAAWLSVAQPAPAAPEEAPVATAVLPSPTRAVSSTAPPRTQRPQAAAAPREGRAVAVALRRTQSSRVRTRAS